MQPHSHRHTHAVRVFHQSMGMCTYFTHAIETKQFCMHSTYILCTAYTIYLFFLLGFFSYFFSFSSYLFCSSSFSRWLFIAFRIGVLFCSWFSHSLLRTNVLLWWGGCSASIVISQESKLRYDCICACFQMSYRHAEWVSTRNNNDTNGYKMMLMMPSIADVSNIPYIHIDFSSARKEAKLNCILAFCVFVYTVLVLCLSLLLFYVCMHMNYVIFVWNSHLPSNTNSHPYTNTQ